MSSRDTYKPGPARGADIHKDGDTWTLVLIREMRHPPVKVWQALTDPHSCANGRPSTPIAAWLRSARSNSL
jgi:hypothetical protein